MRRLKSPGLQAVGAAHMLAHRTKEYLQDLQRRKHGDEGSVMEVVIITAVLSGLAVAIGVVITGRVDFYKAKIK